MFDFLLKFAVGFPDSLLSELIDSTFPFGAEEADWVEFDLFVFGFLLFVLFHYIYLS